MNRTFKILCEVKLLHEFYLTEGEGNTIFDLTAQADRMDFLQKRLVDNAPSIGDDIGFELLPADKDIFSGYQLKLLPSYSGFQIAVAVEEKALTGNIIAYAPKIPMPDDLRIQVLLVKKNHHIDEISNAGLDNTFPGSYLFSNVTLSGLKTYPFLSTPIAPRKPLLPYQQGELALDPSDNSIKAFYTDAAGVEQWAAVRGEGFVHEGDRIAIPTRFYYSLSKFSGATQLHFALLDSHGTSVQDFQFTVKPSDKNVFVQFDDRSLSMADREGLKPDTTYSLKVDGNNGLSTMHPIVFTSAYLPAECWGLVVLQPKVAQTQFSLIDQDGLLLTRKDPAGDVMPPLFEIRLKSRFLFWRYRNNRNIRLKPNASLDPYLLYNSVRGIMDSISFRNATYNPTLFSDGTNTRLLPNPPSIDMLVRENNRVYADIPVPRSDLFDI